MWLVALCGSKVPSATHTTLEAAKTNFPLTWATLLVLKLISFSKG